ncbi:response regulator transcription factor [Streptomyces massasporeus]|uniref:response regulator transcription factor n=1 Tax=Streptomyces massasporeus TaxID=67324 RepID=UPI0037B9AD5D
MASPITNDTTRMNGTSRERVATPLRSRAATPAANRAVSMRYTPQAVRLIAEGESLLFPASVRQLAAEYGDTGGNRAARAVLERAQLTEREAEVLRLMARGLSNAEIAARLVVGTETVKSHVSAVLSKLEARDRTQAVIAAYESGFVAPG